MGQVYFKSNLSNRDMMNRVQVGQKRAGTPLTNQIVKQRQAMPAQRNTRPAQAKDVKEKIHKTGRPNNLIGYFFRIRVQKVYGQK